MGEIYVSESVFDIGVSRVFFIHLGQNNKYINVLDPLIVSDFINDNKYTGNSKTLKVCGYDNSHFKCPCNHSRVRFL